MMNDETCYLIAHKVADRKGGHDSRNLLKAKEMTGGTDHDSPNKIITSKNSRSVIHAGIDVHKKFLQRFVYHTGSRTQKVTCFQQTKFPRTYNRKTKNAVELTTKEVNCLSALEAKPR